jgi:glutamyl-tRNA reductase
MKLRVIGCSHHTSDLEMRESLAFNTDQARTALVQLRQRYPETEVVLLSTCNRMEIYFASAEAEEGPSVQEIARFLADFHGVDSSRVAGELFAHVGEAALFHLFHVAASLDSMVVGEPQILSQVKQAYELATAESTTGPLSHGAFQAAIRVAKRVSRETAIHQKRVSIPSVAVVDFAKQLFERFDDKSVLVIGAGEMGRETLRYLIDEGAHDITIVNRHPERAEELARQVAGTTAPWEQLPAYLISADLIVSTTGSREFIVTVDQFKRIIHDRAQRPLFVLDLAVPRDFDPHIGQLPGVYLYSLDDLRDACEANRRERESEWPRAERIIQDEAARFMAEWNHRATAPTIRRLKALADEVKSDELNRLFNKLGDLNQRDQEEIGHAFERLVNKLLHPPLESLREEAARGTPHGLLEALKRLFRISD